MEFIFDEPRYIAARESRLRNLFRHLDVHSLSGKRILEVGCGTGELGQAFVEAGCQVVSLEARPEYIQELQRRFPGREAYTVDLEKWNPETLGRFDALLCFGLLYHLSTPEPFLAACARLAPEIYLETVVTDSHEPVCPLVSEEGADQAYSGRGCRPSPAWLHQTLSRLGLSVRDISSPDANWGGMCPSVFDWTPLNDGQSSRGGGLLRKMLICSRSH